MQEFQLLVCKEKLTRSEKIKGRLEVNDFICLDKEENKIFSEAINRNLKDKLYQTINDVFSERTFNESYYYYLIPIPNYWYEQYNKILLNNIECIGEGNYQDFKNKIYPSLENNIGLYIGSNINFMLEYLTDSDNNYILKSDNKMYNSKIYDSYWYYGNLINVKDNFKEDVNNKSDRYLNPDKIKNLSSFQLKFCLLFNAIINTKDKELIKEYSKIILDTPMSLMDCTANYQLYFVFLRDYIFSDFFEKQKEFNQEDMEEIYLYINPSFVQSLDRKDEQELFLNNIKVLFPIALKHKDYKSGFLLFLSKFSNDIPEEYKQQINKNIVIKKTSLKKYNEIMGIEDEDNKLELDLSQFLIRETVNLTQRLYVLFNVLIMRDNNEDLNYDILSNEIINRMSKKNIENYFSQLDLSIYNEEEIEKIKPLIKNITHNISELKSPSAKITAIYFNIENENLCKYILEELKLSTNKKVMKALLKLNI